MSEFAFFAGVVVFAYTSTDIAGTGEDTVDMVVI